MHNTFRTPLVVLTLLIALCPVPAFSEALDVGMAKQLFIDHRFIAQSEGIALTVHPAQKMGRIVDDQGNAIHGHPSRVMQIDGRIRLYVGADRLTVYESTDGHRFTAAGTVGGGIFTTVYYDEHDTDPARRYKIYWLRLTSPFDPAVDGVYAGYSANGTDVTEVGRVLPFYADNPILLNWDDRIGRYVIFTRALALGSENQRRIGRIEVDDPLSPWPYTATPDDGMFLTTANVPVVLQADETREPFADMYYNAATLYPEAQDVYFMFPALFRHFTRERQPFLRPRVPGQWEDFGMIEVQLAVSRDGIHWERPGRQPYIAMGLADEWDRWLAVMAPGIARDGNYLYQYYGSSGMLHDSIVLREEYRDTPQELGGIGWTRQRLDGFVSADAGPEGGWIETPLLRFSGACLRLNIDTGAMGHARAELRDPSGSPLPGFTLAECEEVGGNFIDQAVYWNGNRDLTALQGLPVRLYLQLTRASLFAFQFTPE